MTSTTRGPYRIFTVLVTAGVLTLSGCKGMSKSGSATSASSAAALATSGGSALGTFQSTVYIYSRTNCVGCHGSSQVPMFAVADVNAAYSTTKTIVNFASIPTSKIAIKAADGHCGGPTCQNNVTLISLIGQWKAAEDAAAASQGPTASPTPTPTFSGPPPAAMLFSTVAVTAPLAKPTFGVPANTNNYIPMRFSLSNLAPSYSDFAGAILEMEIQYFQGPVGNNPGVYRIRNPRIVGNTQGARVQGVYVLFNGRDVNLNTWNSVDATITATTLPATLPAGAMTNVTELVTSTQLVVANGPNDTFTLGFNALSRPNANGACRSLATFVANVKPNLQTSCFGCHNGGSGTAAFDMRTAAGDDATLCMRTLAKANKTTPNNSLLIQKPRDGLLGHTVIAAPNYQNWINWIMTE